MPVSVYIGGMDYVGKVFLVEQGARRCCICEELFTREASRIHANVSCQPKACQLNPTFARAVAAGQSQ